MSDPALLTRAFSVGPLTYACIDGNRGHLDRNFSLIQIGTQDGAQQYYPLAYGLMTGEEREIEIALVLQCLDAYLKESNISACGLPARLWMEDGGSGIRQGLRTWYNDKPDPKLELKIAMCLRHVLNAVKSHKELLPRRQLDVSQVISDVKKLSELLPEEFTPL